jgi:choline dehydrogenase-like flavoprotein
MGLIDLVTIPAGQAFNADVVIVGAGVAGLVLADALRGSGMSVDVLEAGGATLEPESQALYEAEMVGVPHLGTNEGRFRVYGGSSIRWGGQLLPLRPSDFNQRPHIPFSGWPINSSDLEPYIRSCEEILGVNHAPYDSDLLEKLPMPRPSLTEPDLQLRFSKWAPFRFRNLTHTLGRRCLAEPRIRIFIHACVSAIELHVDGNHVENVKAVTPNGNCYSFGGKQIVISAGSIETSRLLLASRSIHTKGICNITDQLGRWFHDHLSVKAATLMPIDRRKFLNKFAPWFVGDTRHTIKLETSDAWQEKHSCLNVMGHLVFQSDESSAFAWLRQQLLAQQSRIGGDVKLGTPSLRQLPEETLDLLYLLWKRLARKRRWCPSNAEIKLCIDTEQQPNPESRIRLSKTLDAIGMPKAVVQWQWGEPERHAFHTYSALFNRQWRIWDLGEIAWNERFEAGSGWEKGVSDIYHLMGGTRMSVGPQDGIVDKELRVHGIDNLSVASLSVFPTGGSSNPTFTLMMLTLRLAERLMRKE